MKVVKIDDIIDYCEAQISHLYARHETIALAQLRGVKEFCKDSAVDMSAADVQPIKHGRWKYYKNNGIIDTYICTNCQSKVEMAIDVEPSKFKYCPNCGARMDLKDGDTNG